jgi:metal-responsive CopG/Arc/MetJ family transcriptional regulator
MMSNVKTAISLQEELFDQAEQIAREMNISRSRLFTLALEEFITRQRNRQILEQLNAAYSDGLDEGEELRLKKRLYIQKRLVEGEWK